MNSYNKFLLLPIIILDVAGIILVLPVLTPLILEENSILISAHTSIFVKDFLYGFSIAIFPFCMFLSSPVLGDLSDKFGRRKILLICIMGSAIFFLITGIGINYKSLFVFLIGRALGGLMAGTQPIVTAAIIDISSSHTKTINLTWIVFASSLGLVLGPAISGFAGSKNIVSWFNYSTPFFFATGITFLNFLLVFFLLKKAQPSKIIHSIDLSKGFSLFLRAFLNRKYRLIFLQYSFLTLTWGFYYQTINWVLLEKYNYSVWHLGSFFSFIGIIFTFASLTAPFILKLFSNEIKAFSFFILIMGIANAAAALSYNDTLQWIAGIFNATSYVVCFTLSLTQFSNLVDHESQGWIMGVTGAISAFTWTIAGLITGPLGYIYIYLPLWTAVFLCFSNLLLSVKHYYDL
jgi:DHA1 family tetracycline resistance protein-like MFS transporter